MTGYGKILQIHSTRECKFIFSSVLLQLHVESPFFFFSWILMRVLTQWKNNFVHSLKHSFLFVATPLGICIWCCYCCWRSLVISNFLWWVLKFIVHDIDVKYLLDALLNMRYIFYAYCFYLWSLPASNRWFHGRTVSGIFQWKIYFVFLWVYSGPFSRFFFLNMYM